MINRQSRHYSWFLLGVLSLSYLCATLDRIVISLLVDPIKADLGLTDTQISFLQGPAFLLVFAVSAIPVGVLVDRTNRTRLLAFGVGVWSVMTALCGLASSFWMFFFVRAGVGIGEATLNPTGFSLISDAFEKRRLGLALGIFTMGGAIGSGLSLMLGGYAIGTLGRHGDYHLPVLGVLHPWQLTFVLLAIPGVIISLIVGGMPNPARKIHVSASIDAGSISAVIRFYQGNAALLTRHHIASGVTSMVLLGGYSWIAPLFFRVHGWDPAAVGFAAGLAIIIGNPVGLLGGGALGDYLLRRGPQMRLWVCAMAMICGAVFALLYSTLSDPTLAIVFFGGMAMFVTVPFGVGNAALQHIVPSEIRGKVSAIYYSLVHVLGMFGPTMIAVTSDKFFRFPSGIAYATAIVLPSLLLIAAALWLWTIPPYRRFVEKLNDQPDQKS
jgi:MFS family permease